PALLGDTSRMNEEMYAGDTQLEGVCGDGVTERKSVIAMVSATEARSEHPLAKAIATYGKDLIRDLDINSNVKPDPQPEVVSFESVTGAGVKAILTHKGVRYTILVGQSKFIQQDDQPSLPSSLHQFERHETNLGRTIIYVGIQRHVAGSSSSRPIPVL